MKLAVSIEYFKETNSFRIANLGSMKVPILKDGKILNNHQIVDGVTPTDLAENLKLSEYNRESNEIFIEDSVLFINISDDTTPSEYKADEVIYELNFNFERKEEGGAVIFNKNTTAKVVRNGEIQEYPTEKATAYMVDTFEDFIETIKENKIFEDYNKIKLSNAAMYII